MTSPQQHLSALAFMLIAIAGCESKVSEPRPAAETASVRLVHGGSENAGLNLKVDGRVVVQNLAATGISSYATVDAGTRSIEVTVAGTNQTLVTRTVTMEAGKEYSFLVSGTLNNPEGRFASDTAFIPLPGKVKIRVLHAAPSAPPLDVYLTPPGADLGAAITLIEPFAYNLADTAMFPGFAERDPGTWQVRFTDDNTTNVLLDTGPFETVAGQIVTVVLSDNGAGGIMARIIDETPGQVPQTVFIRVSHNAPSVPVVDVHITDPGADLSQPHLFIAPFNYGVDSSTVTFLLPTDNGARDIEVRFTDHNSLNVLASSGTFSVPVHQGRRVTLEPAQGGGVEAVVTSEP
ncbi:MAG: DUF4397 domain-containing protein [Gemmatimonadota bacterium]